MNPSLLGSQFETLEEPADCLTIDITESPRGIVKAIKEHFQLEAPDK
jgi:gluconate kinase